MRDPKKHFIQIGDGPEADPAEIDKRIRLILKVLRAIDGPEPRLESGVAVAAIKVMIETALERNIDVHIAEASDDNAEALKKELKERYERTGSVAPGPPTHPTDPSIH